MAVRAERLQQLGGQVGHRGGHHHHQQHQHQHQLPSPRAHQARHGAAGLHADKQGQQLHALPSLASLASLHSPTASRASQQQQQQQQRPLRPLNAVCAAKRKSAVELLQESKAFYVKSDCVLDRQQRLQRPSPPCSPVPLVAPLAGSVSALLSPPPSPSPLSSPCSGVGAMGAEPMPPAPPGFQQETGPSPPVAVASSAPWPPLLLLPKSPRLGGLGSAGTTWGQRRAASQQLQSDRLQNKLRRLLNADSKENVFLDAAADEHVDGHTVGGERALRAYGRSSSQTHDAWPTQAPGSLHKSLPDLHASPPPRRAAVPRWSSENSSNRGSSTSSHSGDGCGYADYAHRRSGSQRGSRSLQFPADSMSVVSSGGHTHQSHHSQPASAAREASDGELRRGGSSGSSSGPSGARTHRSQPAGRTRANTVSEALVRQSSGGSSAAMSGKSSWSPRCRPRPATSQYHGVRGAGAAPEELGASRGSRGSRGSLGSRGSSHKSDHENYLSPPHCSRVAELCWNFEPRRPILRSKSDISHRYSGSVNVPLSPPCQDPAQLEKFFEQLGLDSAEFGYVSRTRSESSDSPVFFSSVSSVDSNNGGWNAPWTPHGSGLANSGGGVAASGTAGGMVGSGHSGKIIEQPSIVERNARIIKWLCNCRKAQKEMYQTVGNGNGS